MYIKNYLDTVNLQHTKRHMTKLIKFLSSKFYTWKTLEAVKFRSHYNNNYSEMFQDKRM